MRVSSKIHIQDSAVDAEPVIDQQLAEHFLVHADRQAVRRLAYRLARNNLSTFVIYGTCDNAAAGFHDRRSVVADEIHCANTPPSRAKYSHIQTSGTKHEATKYN